ncbi:MAG: hypothetical protein K5894_09370 [Lachnospiraceae bacterium]|nr:hypothetical protein [Lachnospiraceae bacterium]
MIKKEMRKSVSTLLAAALLAVQLVVPVSAAETTADVEETAVVETSAVSEDEASEVIEETTEAETSSTENEDEVTTQSTDSKISGYSISLNKGYFYTYDKGYYIRPAVDIVLSGNTVVAHLDSKTGTATSASYNATNKLKNSDSRGNWVVYYQANYCASDSDDYHYGTYGTAAVVAYNKSTKDIISETFKIIKSKKLKLSKTQVYGVEKRESSSAAIQSQNEARLFYYDKETLHYYPLMEGVDYTASVTQTSSKKGQVTFSPASGSVWDGSKKKKFAITSKKKKCFSDPTLFTVSLNYTKNNVKYSMKDYEEIEYTGSKIKSEIEVILLDEKGNKLTQGSDYKVKFAKNKDVGIATIKITPAGSLKSSYTGSIIRYFRIMPYMMTPRYENYISSSTTKQANDPYARQFYLGYGNSKGYYGSYGFSNGTANSYTYTYTGKIITPTKTKLDFDGDVKSVSTTTKYTTLYVLNGKKKRSKTYDSANPTNTPTCFIFGKGRYGGYAGSYRFTIKSSGSDSDDE